MPKGIGLIYRPVYQLFLATSHYSFIQCRRFCPTHAPARRSLEFETQPILHHPPQVHVVLGNEMSGRPSAPPPSVDDALDALSPFLKSKSASLDVLITSINRIPIILDCLITPKPARLLVERVTATHPHHAPLVLRLAHRVSAGSSIRKNAYECVAHHLAAQQRWKLVLEVFELANEDEKVTRRILNWYTRAALELQDYTRLNQVLGKFAHYRISPQRRTYQLLISGFLQNGDLRRAREVMHAMHVAGMSLDADTHALVAIHHRPFGSNPQIENRALASTQAMPPKTSTIVLNMLLKQRLAADNMDAVVLVISQFDYQQTIPLIVALMNITPSDDSPFASSLNIAPNAQTYAVVMNHLAARHDFRGTMKLLTGMIGAGVEPDGHTVAALLHLYSATNDADAAVQVVHMMCRRFESRTELEALFSPRSSLDLPFNPTRTRLSIQIINSLLRILLSIHGLDSAIIIFRVLKLEGLTFTVSTVTILLQHLANHEKTPPTSLIRTWKHFTLDVLPDLPQLHAVMSRILRHERYLLYGRGWNRSAGFLRRRNALTRHTPSEEKLTSVSELFDPAAGIEPVTVPRYSLLMEPILTSLRSRGVYSDSAMFALRLQRDATQRHFRQAQSIFNALLQRGFQPNAYHYSALMEGFTRSGDLESARSLMKNAENSGVKPNVVMYTILIVGFARQGDTTEAVETFQQMISSGVQPDVASIDAVASAYFVAGRYRQAREVLIDLWSYIAPFPQQLQDASLRHLAVEFRKMNVKPDPAKRLSKDGRQVLYQKLKALMRAGGGEHRIRRQ